MKTFRSLTILSAVGLVGLWGCNSKQYTAGNDAEYDDLYGNSSSVAVAVKPGSQDEEKRSLRNYNPDYRTGQQQPNTTTDNYDYYDESYLSSRGIQRNVGPNAGYNSGFSDGYQTAMNNNWGSYWNNPYRSFGMNSFGYGSSLMLGFGYGFGSSFYNPYRFGFSPYGYNSAFAYSDPFYSPYSYYSPYSAWGGYSSFGWSPWGYSSFYSPYSFYGSSYYANSYYGGYYGNNNVWYNGPTNNIQIVDARRRPGTDYYNRVDRSANAYNRNNDNSPRYTNEGRRQSYDPSARTNSSTSTTSDGYYSRPRGGADRSYDGYSSNSGSRSSNTYGSPSQSSGYSSGTRGGATRSYGDQSSSSYSNQRSSSYSNNNSSNSYSNSYNNSNSGRSSYSSPSPSYSSPSSSSSSSGSSHSSSGSSRGPR